MNRVEKILLRVRDTLSDPYKEKWSDEQLIRLINEAQLDIVREAHLLKKKTLVPLIEGSNIVKLPDDFYILLRVIYKDCELEVKDHLEFELLCRDSYQTVCSQANVENPQEHWEKHIGCEPKFLVFDLANPYETKIYPIPNCLNGEAEYLFLSCSYAESLEDGVIDDFGTFGYFLGEYEGFNYSIPDFGVTSEVSNSEIFDFATLDSDWGVVWSVPINLINLVDGRFGVVTDVECFNVEDVYGVATDIGYNGEMEDLYGVVTELTLDPDYLEIHYIKKPKFIESVNDELEIPDIWDIAIQHYVCAMAFRNDLDAQHRQMAAEEWQLYQLKLRKIKKDAARDFTGRNHFYKTKYFDIFSKEV